ncbi:MAG: NAD(+)/NADH kinase [Firmicutes bacterium]|nr:NAD(+)/NADH kinase [Bacillota bacterium]
MALVGIIINPMAGRDIRRLVAQADVISYAEKVQTLLRIAAGCQALTSVQVGVIDDRAGLARQAVQQAGASERYELFSQGEEEGGEHETLTAIHYLQRAGAGAIVVVGGDGTQRLAAQAHPTVPILPVAGGTNNASTWSGDQTIAGMAAAAVAAAGVGFHPDIGLRMKIIHAHQAGRAEEIAVMDMAWVESTQALGQAVWDTQRIRRVLLASADPIRPGLSHIGGLLAPVAGEEDRAVQLSFNPSDPVRQVAVVAPGLIGYYPQPQVRYIALGEHLRWNDPDGGQLVCDGEPCKRLTGQDVLDIFVERDGPFAIDPRRALLALAPGIF